MIYTDSIIDYNRTDAQLEELILFLVLVANKPANRTAYLLEEFLKDNLHRPFDHIRDLIRKNKLRGKLEKFKTGQYTRIEKAFKQLVNTHTGDTLRNVTRDELIKIHGIGLKSASCFICWCQNGVRYSMLDTHILKFMNEELGVETPKGTPAKKKYMELEQVFLAYADKLKRNPTELDLEIWSTRRI
jgi:thermostable 8-oxoguanine DNA glycosylase